MAGACRDSTPFPRAREQRNTPCVGFWTCPVLRNRVWNRLKYRQTKHYSLRLLTLWRRKITWFLYRDSVRTAQSTSSLGYRNQSAKILIGYLNISLPIALPSSFPNLYLATCLPLPEEREVTPWELSEQQTLRIPFFPIVISVVPLVASPPTVSLSLSLSLS